MVLVTQAGVQDPDGAQPPLRRLRFAMPSVAHVWADGGYAGQLVEWASRLLRVTLEVVHKPAGQDERGLIPGAPGAPGFIGSVPGSSSPRTTGQTPRVALATLTSPWSRPRRFSVE